MNLNNYTVKNLIGGSTVTKNLQDKDIKRMIRGRDRLIFKKKISITDKVELNIFCKHTKRK